MRGRSLLATGGGLGKTEGQELLAYIESLEMKLAQIAEITTERAVHDLAIEPIAISARLQEIEVLRAAKEFIIHRNSSREMDYRNTLQKACFRWTGSHFYSRQS